MSWLRDFVGKLPPARVQIATREYRSATLGWGLRYATTPATLPQLEFASLIQDVPTLEALVTGTGGKYLTLKEAAEAAPPLIPNKGERIIIDQRIKELWDRSWVLYLLVTLLGAEWLTRKLLRLA